MYACRYFTRPLKGSIFTIMRGIFQGIVPIDELAKKHKIKNKTSMNDSTGFKEHKECAEKQKSTIKAKL